MRHRFDSGADARATDDVVLARAFEDSRILLTEDKDFGDLTVRLGKPAIGIILLRIDIAEHELKLARLTTLIERFGHRLAGQYTVVSTDRFRFRMLGPRAAPSSGAM